METIKVTLCANCAECPSVEISDEGSAAEPALDVYHTLLFEGAQGFAKGDAASLELARHLPLRRQLMTRLKLPAKNRLTDLFGHRFTYATAFQRRDFERGRRNRS